MKTVEETLEGLKETVVNQKAKINDLDKKVDDLERALNGMYAIMFLWILLIWQNDASSLTMRILLQSYSRRNLLNVFLQLI